MGLLYNPSVPSLSYLFSHSQAQALHLWRSLATWAATIPWYTTLRTSSILSFVFASCSDLWILSKDSLVRAKWTRWQWNEPSYRHLLKNKQMEKCSLNICANWYNQNNRLNLKIIVIMFWCFNTKQWINLKLKIYY